MRIKFASILFVLMQIAVVNVMWASINSCCLQIIIGKEDCVFAMVIVDFGQSWKNKFEWFYSSLLTSSLGSLKKHTTTLLAFLKFKQKHIDLFES